MNKHLPEFLHIGLLFILLLFGTKSSALDRIFTANQGNWNTATNWSPIGVPAVNDHVLISSGSVCVVDAPLIRQADIWLESEAKLQVNSQLQLISPTQISISQSAIFDVTQATIRFFGSVSVGGSFLSSSQTRFVFESVPLGVMPLLHHQILGDVVVSNSTVVLQADLEVAGKLQIGAGSQFKVSAQKLTLSDLVDDGALVLEKGFYGSTIEFTGMGSLVLKEMELATLVLNRKGTVRMASNLRLGRSLVIGEQAELIVPASASIRPSELGFQLINRNRLLMDPGSNVLELGSGMLENLGLLRLSGTFSLNGQFTNLGTVEWTQTPQIFIQGGFHNFSSGKFNMAGTNAQLNLSIASAYTFKNEGIFKTGVMGTFTSSSQQTQAFENTPTASFHTGLPLHFINATGKLILDGNLVGNLDLKFEGDGSMDIVAGKDIMVNRLDVNLNQGEINFKGPGKLIMNDRIAISSGTLNLNNQPVVLSSNAFKTARIAEIKGELLGATQVTNQRHIGLGQPSWVFLGTPIYNQTISQWSDNFYTSGPFPGAVAPAPADRSSIFEFDGASSPTGALPGELFGWRIPMSGKIEAGKGYRVFLNSSFFNGPKTIDNTGAVVSGTFDFKPTFSSQGFGGGGWNFFANPYPSAIDWNATYGWEKSQIGAAIYVWNSQMQQYGAYIAGMEVEGEAVGINGANNLIASGQAFFVKAFGPNPILKIKESAKTDLSRRIMRTNTENHAALIRIALSDANGGKDEHILRLHPEATRNFDPELDAQKLSGSTLSLASFSSDNQKLCINSIQESLDQQIEIPLEVSTNGQGPFQIRFNLPEIDPFQVNVYLFDGHLNQAFLLSNGFTHQFSTNGGSTASDSRRFKLLFSPYKGVASLKSDYQARLWTTKNKEGQRLVKLENFHPVNTELEVIDPLGKIVFTKRLVPSETEECILPTLHPNVFYMVRLRQDQQILITRFLDY